MKLNFGFEDKQYEYQNKSVGRVAELLEAQYNIVDTFFTIKEHEILEILIESRIKRLEAEFEGKHLRTVLPRVDAMKIESLFRKTLNNRELDGIIPGVPTQAALEGERRGRKKSKSARASFVNSGTFRDSFKVWVEK